MNHGHRSLRRRAWMLERLTVESVSKPSGACAVAGGGATRAGRRGARARRAGRPSRSAVRLVQLLERPLAQVDAEVVASELDRPARGLVAGRLPAGLAGDVEEEAEVGADLEEAASREGVAARGGEHPVEELPPALLLGEVLVVDDLLVGLPDPRRVERRHRADHPAGHALDDVVMLREVAAGAAELGGEHRARGVAG